MSNPPSRPKGKTGDATSQSVIKSGKDGEGKSNKHKEKATPKGSSIRICVDSLGGKCESRLFHFHKKPLNGAERRIAEKKAKSGQRQEEEKEVPLCLEVESALLCIREGCDKYHYHSNIAPWNTIERRRLQVNREIVEENVKADDEVVTQEVESNMEVDKTPEDKSEVFEAQTHACSILSGDDLTRETICSAVESLVKLDQQEKIHDQHMEKADNKQPKDKVVEYPTSTPQYLLPNCIDNEELYRTTIYYKLPPGSSISFDMTTLVTRACIRLYDRAVGVVSQDLPSNTVGGIKTTFDVKKCKVKTPPFWQRCFGKTEYSVDKSKSLTFHKGMYDAERRCDIFLKLRERLLLAMAKYRTHDQNGDFYNHVISRVQTEVAQICNGHDRHYLLPEYLQLTSNTMISTVNQLAILHMQTLTACGSAKLEGINGNALVRAHFHW